MKVSTNDYEKFCVLEQQARAIESLYSKTIMAFDEAADEWEAHSLARAHSTHLFDHTSSDAYGKLVLMGKAVVPFIMVRYANDTNGWWHILLHQIEHGSLLGYHMIDKQAQWEGWRRQFLGHNGYDE